MNEIFRYSYEGLAIAGGITVGMAICLSLFLRWANGPSTSYCVSDEVEVPRHEITKQEILMFPNQGPMREIGPKSKQRLLTTGK